MMSKEPNFFPEDEAYWEAARKGILLLPLCLSCGKFHFYPRGHCPHCGSRNLKWHAASGHGKIYSYTVADIKGRESVMPAIVELEEGIRLTSVITCAEGGELYIGQEVKAHFEPCKNGTCFLHFRTPQALQAQALIQDWISERKHALSVVVEQHALAPVQTAAVIGAGNMGTTIALAFVLQGIQTTLVDSDPLKLEQAHALIARKTAEFADKNNNPSLAARATLLIVSQQMEAIAAADWVIESVWEDMETKQQVLRSIEQHVSPHCPIGSNTSTFDIDVLASVMQVPQRLIGLHFFNPAHVIALVEIIKGGNTNVQTHVKAQQLCHLLQKVPVEVGICHGFAANRMMIAREKEARQLLLEGATPHQVDQALRKFGLPMGPFELQDMTGGIEVNYRRRQSSGEKDAVIDALIQIGRLGKKNGAGFYAYQDGKALPKIDSELQNLLMQLAQEQGIERRAFSEQEILERLMKPLVQEGQALLAEGMVQSAKDIDLIWSLGFGWPKHKVGPMYWSAALAVRSDALTFTSLL